MTDRIPLDHLTSDALDQLYEGLDRANKAIRFMLQSDADAADTAVRAIRLMNEAGARAKQAEAAVLREADWIVEHCPDHGCVEPETDVCHCEIADRLRLMADEPQQPSATEASCPGCGCKAHAGFCDGCGCLDSRERGEQPIEQQP